MKRVLRVFLLIVTCSLGVHSIAPNVSYADSASTEQSASSLAGTSYGYEELSLSNNIADTGQLNDPDEFTVSLENGSFEYTGRPITPCPLVYCGELLLEEGVDYLVSYSNNIIPGTASIAVTGIGDFAGSSSQVNFEITRSEDNLISLPGSWKHDAKGWWYALSDGGFLKSSVQVIDGISYRFDDSGYLYCGWYWFDNAWHYSSSSGEMLSGWVKVNDFWYYLDLDTGAMKSGWVFIDDAWYHFNNSGVMNIGWLYLGGAWYYLQPSGAMAQDWCVVNGSWYNFGDDGAMRSGWLLDKGSWYFLNDSGRMVRGWLSLNGVWYYLSGFGSMVTGRCSIDGSFYYFNQSGSMLTGWIETDDGWYFASKSGTLKSGWLLDGAYWYWLDPSNNGLMAVGNYDIENSAYYFADNGQMFARTWIQLEDGVAAHASSSGAIDIYASYDQAGNVICSTEMGDRYSGWKKFGSSWFYFNSDGLFTTGWQFIGGSWYYFYTDGSMALGWLADGQHWYYLSSSGAMVTGWNTVDGHYYQFGFDGSLWEPQWTASTDLQRRLVSACYSVPSPGPNYCSEWVALVFSRIGLGQMLPNNDYDADDMFYAYCNSGDLRDLRVGMIIAVPSHTHNYAGYLWGHICIYVGNNTVMDNIGRIRTMSLDAWLDYYTTNFSPKWGWYNHYPLG